MILSRMVCAVALCAASCLPAFAQAGEPYRLVVETRDGAVLHGAIDARTSPERLWLRAETGHISLARPIEWSAIKTATHDGKPVPVRVLMRQFVEWSSVWQPANDVGEETEPDSQPAARNEPAERLASLEIDATVANWDADVEVDGLVVRVWPVSTFGTLMPVRGTLDVDLVGLRHGPNTRGTNSPQIGRWSQALTAADYGPDGAVVRLPFQAVHPDFDASVGPVGLVHARLSAPGEACVEATSTDVRIRPYSATRDWLLQSEHIRFLPIERTGRSRPSDAR